ncbi:MAG TPA: thioredoxin domain-containing protein [Verrucomicrobiae bacterium]|nr:thioredoxin domain-containing protein [Verrucomicrobiae bacterium]
MPTKRALIFAMMLFALGMAAGTYAQSQTNSTVTTSNPASPPSHSHTNRLAREKSPYLLQHQHNPVDWYAWGDEAFARARNENKPIFLSIGYSTCHWCHVMERESFEDEKLAKYLNEHFVSIKVDREERPDVDKIYMTFVQSTTGGGGWPLNCFLTPDLKPFFGGTYFPPESKYGRPSFLELLQQITKLWQTRHGDVTNSAEELHERLAATSDKPSPGELALTPEVLTNAATLFKRTFDPQNGGFGDAPKFPQPSQPAFLLRYGVRFKDDEAVKMVLQTCERMAAGGIHDQIGGGFARYSVDAQWLVPHFEKMLYDNAQLVNLYLDAWLVSRDARDADTARDILRYVLRDMTHPGGGFYSAEDADSEGKEGKFYCWTREELSKLLTPEEFNVATRYFGITEQGNFVDHSDPQPLRGQNVLSIVQPKLTKEDEALLKSAKEKMFAARGKRVRPHLDDKVLASWNGLMLGAMARAYAVLGDETYRVAAEKNLSFLRDKLWDAKTATLHHRWRDGERDSVQLQQAYAYLLAGVIDLYEATLDPKHLDFAIALADSMTAKFEDKQGGGFWQSAADAPDLIMRVKEDYDGAEPSGNSVAALALLKLAAITGRDDYKKSAEGALRFASERLQKIPQAVPCMLLALDYSLEEPKRVVIAGDPAMPDTKALLHAAHSIYQPGKVVSGIAGAVEPFAKTLPAKEGAVVYLCTGNACQPPTKDAAQLKEMLAK